MTQETQVRGCPLCHIMDSSMNASQSSSPLPAAFDHQDEVFADAFSILKEAITERAFPAASIAVTHRGRLVVLKALGHFIYDDEITKDEIAARAPSFASFAKEPALSLSKEPALSLSKGGSDAVNPATLFDLASLTKVIATTPMAMILYERGLLDLDAPVTAIIPEFTTDSEKDPRRHEVTLRMLLSHSSGLPAYEKLFLKARTRAELLQAIFTMPLAANPATRTDYSDIGFILLGLALERLADESLDRFC